MATGPREVEFWSEGETVRADLYLPEGATPGSPVPAIVMAGGWCYVKELIQPEYAKYFVPAGFAVLIFDYRHLGASDGTPRQHVDPYKQMEDYKNAISYLETLDEIDSSRIGIWGISYSGGHVLVVGATDPRVKCIVSNIPVVDGLYNMRRAHGHVGFRKIQEAVLEDRRERARTGKYGTVAMSAHPEEELSTWPYPETKAPFMALKAAGAERHEHLNTVASVELLMTYNVRPYLNRILNTPTMMIVADGDDFTMWEAEIPCFREIAAQQKELIVISDTTHMTLYSDFDRTRVAAEHARDWFVEHLHPER
jgi:pimeloyl-ACP methyl ester carboxylesterase